MTRFHFRLQTLLKLREADRQQRRVELAQAYQAEKLLQRQFSNLTQQERTLQKQSRFYLAPGRVPVERLRDAHRHVLLLKAQAQQLLEKQGQLEEEIERRRRALIEADRQVRVLEKLRERQLEQHRATEDAREVKALDEVAQRVWGDKES
jgi:flagellar FliJ protein